jgi:hypothetical protein
MHSRSGKSKCVFLSQTWHGHAMAPPLHTKHRAPPLLSHSQALLPFEWTPYEHNGGLALSEVVVEVVDVSVCVVVLAVTDVMVWVRLVVLVAVEVVAVVVVDVVSSHVNPNTSEVTIFAFLWQARQV